MSEDVSEASSHGFDFLLGREPMGVPPLALGRPVPVTYLPGSDVGHVRSDDVSVARCCSLR